MCVVLQGVIASEWLIYSSFLPLCLPSHLLFSPPLFFIFPQQSQLTVSLSLFRHSPFRQHKTKDKHEIDRMTLTMVSHVHTPRTFPRSVRCTVAKVHTLLDSHSHLTSGLCTHCKTQRQYEALLKPDHMGLACVYLSVIPNAHRCLYPYAYYSVCEQTSDACNVEKIASTHEALSPSECVFGLLRLLTEINVLVSELSCQLL